MVSQVDTMTSPQRRRSDGSRPAARMTKAERKRQLLAHAKHLFVTQGYHATTTEKIAQAAGVTEPVLYRHFANKKALFLEVLEEVRAATLERWHAETSSVTDPLAKLHAIADMYLGSTRAHAVEFRIMHRTLVETDDEEIVALLRGFYLDSETLLTHIIAEGQQAGVFRRSLDPRVGAWEMIRTALGYTLTLPLGIPLFVEENYLPQAIDCLLHCLLKTDV
jgi:AcrR family transcriptional regulator